MTHATETATTYLPWIDVGLFVLSPEPPLTDDERAYLLKAQHYAAKLALILTKTGTAPADFVQAVAAFACHGIAEATGMRNLPVLSLCRRAWVGCAAMDLRAHARAPHPDDAIDRAIGAAVPRPAHFGARARPRPDGGLARDCGPPAAASPVPPLTLVFSQNHNACAQKE